MRSKRILAVLLTVIMVVSLFPTYGLAAGEEDHGTHAGWTELTKETLGYTYELSTGKYYLSSNLTINNPIKIIGQVELCLNGYKLSSSGNSTLDVSGTSANLTIYDCAEGGIVENTARNGIAAVNVGASKTLRLYGGTLNGGSHRGVGTDSHSKVYIYGGTIAGTDAEHGALEISGADVYMTGGKVEGNISLSSTAELYLGGAPEISGKVVFVHSSCSLYAAANETPYSGDTVQIEYKPTPSEGTKVVYGVSEENKGKFLLTDSDGKYLVQNGDDLTFSSPPPAAGHKHGVDGGEGNIEWTEWDGTTNLDAPGYYYLKDSVEVRSNLIISADVHLCLNGKTLTIAGNYFSMKVNGGNLSICDCGSNGAIRRTETADTSIAISVLNGTLTLYGGAIVSEAEGVYVYNESDPSAAKFDMRGGSISAVKGIDNRKGTVDISAGSVTFSGMYGINSSGGSVTLSGGTIAPAETGDAKYGANITAGTFHMSGTASVSGKERGIYLVVRNTSEGARISGGSISGTGENGYGLWQAGEAPVYLSGTPSISGTGAALYIPTYSYPIYGSDGGALYSGEPLTVYYNGYTETTEPIIHSATDVSKFTLVYPEGKYLVLSGSNLVLSDTPPVTGHPQHGVDGGAGDIEWTEWDGKTALEANGYYYLGDNVVLTKEIIVSDDVHLCLNGKTISRASGDEVFEVTSGMLTICDCESDGEVSISGNSSSAAVRLTKYGKLTLYGGTLDGGAGNGVFASGSSTKVTIADGTVSGTRSGGALGVDSGTAIITGGTVEGIRLQGIYGKVYLGSTPSVGSIQLYTTSSTAKYQSKIYAAADSEAYAGGPITINTKYTNMAPGTDIVYDVNNTNANSFTLTDYQLARQDDNLVIAYDKDITLEVTVPELVYGDTKNIAVTVDPSDAVLTYKVIGKTPFDPSNKIVIENGRITAGAPGNFKLTVTATRDGYNQAVKEVDFTVAKAPLTVTADAKTIAYGDSVPVYTAEITGFVNGETAAVLGGTLAFDCDYTKGSPVGTYAITPSGLTSDNYAITYTEGTLTVEQANYPDPVTPPADLAATYGDTLADITLPTDPNGTWSWKAETTTSVGNAGENSFTLVFTPTNTNYKPVEVQATVTVAKAALTVRANNFTITYGDPVPVYTAEITGFVNGETAAVLGGALTFDCDYTQGRPDGTYVITPKGLTSDNYAIEFVSGTLTVTKKQVPTPTAPVVKTLTYNAGLQNLVLPGSAEHGTMVYSLSENGPWSTEIPQGRNAGTYRVWYMVQGDTGYSDTTPDYVTAEIQKAPLTITADNKTITVGDSMPVLTYTVRGLLGTDTLTVSPVLICHANTNRVGTYPIYISGAVASNYQITYINGILVVKETPVIPVPGHSITVETNRGGEAEASANRAQAGQTIYVTVDPDIGYALESIQVTTVTGQVISLSGNHFTMPDCSVTVTVTFRRTDSPFLDVNGNDWFYEEVLWAYEQGLMDGVGGNRFAPNGTVTRAMAVTVLYRMEGRPAATGSDHFSDVAAGSWYDNAVTWASAHDIVLGYGGGKFGPNDPVTREQLAAIFWRYAKYKGYDVSVGENTNILSYPDFDEISDYAIPAFQWACGTGMINGMDGKLNPRGGATRAQLAAMLMRFAGIAK